MGFFNRSLSTSRQTSSTNVNPREKADALISSAVQNRFENWEEAMSLLNQACACAPGYKDPWQWKAEILEVNDRFQEAIDCYRTIQQLEPESWDPHENIALIYFFRLDDKPEALREINSAVDIINERFWANPFQSTVAQDIANNEYGREARVFFWKGLICEGLDKHVEALRSLGRAMYLHPDVIREPDFMNAFERASKRLPSVPMEERFP